MSQESVNLNYGRHCVVESSDMHFRATILEPELHDFKLRVAAPAEPALPAEDASDAPLRFEPPPCRRTDAPLLWRQTREEPLSCAPLLSRPTTAEPLPRRPTTAEPLSRTPSPAAQARRGVTKMRAEASPGPGYVCDSVQKSRISRQRLLLEFRGLLRDDRRPPHRAGPWELAGWAALGLGALLPAAVAMVLERADGGTTPTRLSRSAAISAAGATTTFPAEPAKAPSLPVAATSLALTPATSPVIPPFSEPTADANRPVAPANAPALAPAVVADRSDIEPSSALALLPEGMPPRVLIRYLGSSAEVRRRAEGLAKALIGQGVDVADVRESRAPIRTELSFSYAPDQAIAQQVGRLTGIPPTRAALTKDGLMARPGTVQLSISGR
jgi:hypothetical protein